MSLRYVIEEVSKNGAVDTRAEEYAQSPLSVGRGSDCEIILESKNVSLRHARLSVEGGNLVVEDLGSLGGVKVNDRLVARQQLQSGDVVKLADVTISISKKDGAWTLTERRQHAEKLDVEAAVKADLERLDIRHRLPSYTLTALFFSTLVIVFGFLLPFARERKEIWNSGPLSNKHVALSQNCETCHVAPFVPVSSEQCESCHRMSEHSPLMKASHGLNQDCTSCHIEHEGDKGLVLHKTQTCADCHSNIKGKAPEAKSGNVPSLAAHPQFSVDVPPVEPGTGKLERVSLDDRAKLVDNSNVKLNHELHLKGPIRTRDGSTKSLTCDSCHKLTPDGKTIQPINFESHCQSCHGLGFDERLPNREVPHGNTPDEIYNFLYAEYAKLLLSDRADEQTKAAFRLRPGEREEDPTKGPEFTREFVEQESRSAEQMLFTKTACQLCHGVRTRTDSAEADLLSEGKSRYALLPPQVPHVWMSKAQFSHGAHDTVQCESCHAGVSRSKDTKDVLLPRIDRCQNCHADPGTKHFVSSDCTMCHSYHDKLPLEAAKQQRIEDLLVVGKRF